MCRRPLDVFAGRKKKKDKGGQVYLMMLKGGLLAMAYKGLALLAGKALLVSKIALTLAILVAFKKLFSGGGHGGSSKTTYEIVKQPVMTHSHQYAAPGAADTFGSYDNSGPYARSIAQPDVVPYPQLAAYRAHVRGVSGGPAMMSSAASSQSSRRATRFRPQRRSALNAPGSFPDRPIPSGLSSRS
ncbi:unnamed protein product [Aphis gossypii]|uniref:Uncharacterized protein n=1 Tax=Aphis gossypii TaxID=80765 RepID=A0A9P0IKI4_APHGO|nr:unnamed protein product [Aphis gossypii]